MRMVNFFGKFICGMLLLLPLAVMAAPNWDGAYVGVNIGVANVEADIDTDVTGASSYFIGTDAAQIEPQASPTVSDSSTFNGGLTLGLLLLFSDLMY